MLAVEHRRGVAGAGSARSAGRLPIQLLGDHLVAHGRRRDGRAGGTIRAPVELRRRRVGFVGLDSSSSLSAGPGWAEPLGQPDFVGHRLAHRGGQTPVERVGARRQVRGEGVRADQPLRPQTDREPVRQVRMKRVAPHQLARRAAQLVGDPRKAVGSRCNLRRRPITTASAATRRSASSASVRASAPARRIRRHLPRDTRVPCRP